MDDTPDKPEGNRPLLTPKYSEKLERTKEDIKKGAEEIGLDKAANVVGKISSSLWGAAKNTAKEKYKDYKKNEEERRAYREVLENVASLRKRLWSNKRLDDYADIAKWDEMSDPANIYRLYPKIEQLQEILNAAVQRRDELNKQAELAQIEAKRQAEEAEKLRLEAEEAARKKQVEKEEEAARIAKEKRLAKENEKERLAKQQQMQKEMKLRELTKWRENLHEALSMFKTQDHEIIHPKKPPIIRSKRFPIEDMILAFKADPNQLMADFAKYTAQELETLTRYLYDYIEDIHKRKTWNAENYVDEFYALYKNMGNWLNQERLLLDGHYADRDKIKSQPSDYWDLSREDISNTFKDWEIKAIRWLRADVAILLHDMYEQGLFENNNIPNIENSIKYFVDKENWHLFGVLNRDEEARKKIDEFFDDPFSELSILLTSDRNEKNNEPVWQYRIYRTINTLKTEEKDLLRLYKYWTDLSGLPEKDIFEQTIWGVVFNGGNCEVESLGQNTHGFENYLIHKSMPLPSSIGDVLQSPSQTHYEARQQFLKTYFKNITLTEDITDIKKCLEQVVSGSTKSYGQELVKEAWQSFKEGRGVGTSKFMKATDLGQSQIFANQGNGFMLGELEGSGNPVHFTGDGSLITVGAPSSGKSLCHVMQNLIDHKGSAIVLDIKGEIYDQTAAARAEVSDVYRYAPADVKNSHSYNPLEHITNDEDYFEAECRVLAHTIMHDNTDDKEDFWRKGARDILTAIIGLCIEKKELLEKTIFAEETFSADSMMGVKRIASCENNEMLDITNLMKSSKYELIKAQAREINSLLRGFGKKEGANSEQDSSNGEGAAKLFLSFKSVMNKDLSAWMNTATKKITNTSDWAPNELRERPITIYLCIPKNRVKTDGAILNLLLAQHIEKMLQEEPKAAELPVLLMLDEFAQLGRMEPIINAIEIGRSYGIKTWILCQSMSQIEEKYGKQGARTLLNSCAVENWMRISFDDAKMLADRLGTQRPLFSDNKREPSFEVDELTGVDFREHILTFASGEKPLKLKKLFYCNK